MKPGAQTTGVDEKQQTTGVDEKQLTPREFEVAILMAHGHTNQEVADRLVISVRTAESHRRNLMAKLSARSRADVVRWALDHQLLR